MVKDEEEEEGDLLQNKQSIFKEIKGGEEGIKIDIKHKVAEKDGEK